MISHTWPTFVAAVEAVGGALGALDAGAVVGAAVAGTIVGALVAGAERSGAGDDVDVSGTAGDGPIDAPP